MESCLLLDPSIGTDNKGDDIIMECVEAELQPLLKDYFQVRLPTHVSSFHWYQVWRNSLAVRRYAGCRYKFVGGSNLLVKDMLTHYPQWNVNLFNYRPLKGSVLVGVGASAHEHTNAYTRRLYRKMLSHQYAHSARDQRTKDYLDSLGLKAINTGCVTMWKLTPDFCATIPNAKGRDAVFTLTAGQPHATDQTMLDALLDRYENVWFWPQGSQDDRYLDTLQGADRVKRLQATKDAYDRLLTDSDSVDYVGTRLHAGVYAMRHRRRAIIIVIDERAREINACNDLPCLSRDQMGRLPAMIDSSWPTAIKMPLERIAQWKAQFPELRSSRS